MSHTDNPTPAEKTAAKMAREAKGRKWQDSPEALPPASPRPVTWADALPGDTFTYGAYGPRTIATASPNGRHGIDVVTNVGERFTAHATSPVRDHQRPGSTS